MQSRGDSNLGGHYLGVATIRGELGDRVGRCHVALPIKKRRKVKKGK
jgi:hypothetical protein